MGAYSEIAISEAPAQATGSGHYRLAFQLQLPDAEIGHCSHLFKYSYDVDRSFARYIELESSGGGVVVRVSAEEGDAKSYDMFQLFRGIKSEVARLDYRVRFKRAMFSSEWDCFEGFFPFGMTLIQPPLSSLSSIGGGDFVYVAHTPPSPYLLSLRIYRRTFRALRVLKDLTSRDVIYEKLFDQGFPDCD